MVKALTLYQPLATLAVIGAKSWETRSWRTSFRGRLMIHAALRQPTPDDLPGSAWNMVDAAFQAADVDYRPMDPPLGVILGSVDVTACVPVENVRDHLSEDVIAFGNFADGRFAWQLEDARALVMPVATRGMQGLWTVPRELESDLLGAWPEIS